MTRSRPRPLSRRIQLGWLLLAAFCVSFLRLGAAEAQSAAPPVRPRAALLEWDTDRQQLLLTLAFRDVLDSKIQEKLSRGLPTTIVLTAAVFARNSERAISTTAQTCKVTWHVWEEAYRVELMRPGSVPQVRWTTTTEGVLRRCAETHRLLSGQGPQVPTGVPLRIVGKIQVNPISQEVLTKIQRWVMRPSSTGTAAPGDALFSTFTGLFLQRVGDAERELNFSTVASLPLRFSSAEESR